MSIPAIDGVSAMYTQSSGTREVKNEMSGQDFMMLLIEQLKNQDPSNPMDASEMMSQTLQLQQMESFTRIESQLSEFSALSMRTNAQSLMGQTVNYIDASQQVGQGVVTAIDFSTGVPALTINGSSVYLTAISGVTRPNATSN